MAGAVGADHTPPPQSEQEGRPPPNRLTSMLRIHLLLQWYSISVPAMEESLIEVPAMRS